MKNNNEIEKIKSKASIALLINKCFDKKIEALNFIQALTVIEVDHQIKLTVTGYSLAKEPIADYINSTIEFSIKEAFKAFLLQELNQHIKDIDKRIEDLKKELVG